MNHIERRDKELAYISDESVLQEQIACRKILQKLNFMDRSDFAGIVEVVKELLGKSEGAFINPPGAGSVVTKDIPDWCTAASKDLGTYPFWQDSKL